MDHRAMVPGFDHLSMEQQQMLIQQNVQQWQAYYQQYAQWQAQYGQQYQQELTKLQNKGAQPPLPEQPPPPPPPASAEPSKPPPPPLPSGGAAGSSDSHNTLPQNPGERRNPGGQGIQLQNYGGLQSSSGQGPAGMENNYQSGSQQGGPSFDNFNDGNRGRRNQNQWNQRGNGNQNNRQFGGGQGQPHANNSNNNPGGNRGGRGRGGGNQRGGGRGNGRFGGGGNNNNNQMNPHQNQRGGGRNNYRFNNHNQDMDGYDSNMDFSRDMDYGDRRGNYQNFDNDYGGGEGPSNMFNDGYGGNSNGSDNYSRDRDYGASSSSSNNNPYNQDGDYNRGGMNNNPSRDPQEELRQHLKPTVAQQKQWDAEDDEDERLFDEQFRKWEEQFNNWKVQNQDHPDRSSYVQYERDFEDVRIRLMERRDQMRQRRLNARQEILQKQRPSEQRDQRTPPHFNHGYSKYNEEKPPPPPEIPKGSSTREDFGNSQRDLDEDKMSRPSTNPPENVDNLFDRPGRGGIPGLDLVTPVKEREYIDGEEVINLEEEGAGEDLEEGYPEDEPDQPQWKPTIPQPEDDDDVFFDSNLEVEMENIKAKKEKAANPQNPTPAPDKSAVQPNIDDILKNPNLKKILDQVQGKPEDKPSFSKQPPSNPQPNINDLLRNPNIVGVLDQVKNSMISPTPRQPEPFNVNALLQNPQISTLLNQVQGGLMNQQPSNFNNRIWVNGPGRGAAGGRFSNLPPAFAGPSSIDHDNTPTFSGINPIFQARPMDGNGPFDAPRPDFPRNNFNTLPPPQIHGGKPPLWSRNQDSEGDFQRRPPRSDPPAIVAPEPALNILVPTKVVDYQHRSVAGEGGTQTIDYFHKKAPPGEGRDITNTYTRNVFTTNNQRWPTPPPPKRQSRFDDSSSDPKRPRRQERGRPNRNNDRRDSQRRTEHSRDESSGNKPIVNRSKREERPHSSRDARGSERSKGSSSGRPVEDFLEGISDEEFVTIDEVRDDDNMSLSSIDDFPEEVPADKEIVSIADILLNPGRKKRPRKIMIIIRGLPGSGKTHIAKLIKDKEVEMGGSAPRILSIDDYFTTETDEVVTCPKTGKDINKKSMVYEYEEQMEGRYLQYLLKAYKKTINDGYFDFIIVDAIYQKMADVLEYVTYANLRGFVSYICSLECDVATCFERNTHSRTEEEITAIAEVWEPCPASQLRLDIQPLLDWTEISELPMEDISNDEFEEGDQEEALPDAEAKKKKLEAVKESSDKGESSSEKVDEEKKEADDNSELEGAEKNPPPNDSVKNEENVKVETESSTDKVGESSIVEKPEGNIPELDGENPVSGEEKQVQEKSKEGLDEEEEEVVQQQEEPDNQLEEILENEFEDIEGDVDDEQEQEELSDEAADDGAVANTSLFKSKWDTDPQEDRLAKMDGLSKPLRPPTIEDYLQADEYLSSFEEVQPGKKRVRWADIEEKKAQEKMRAIGFVVGQTDWNRMMDPTDGQAALTKTKFIDRVTKDDPS